MKIACLNLGGKCKERLSNVNGPHLQYIMKNSPDVMGFVEPQCFNTQNIPDIPGYIKIALQANPTGGKAGGRPSGGVIVYINVF